MFHAENKLLQSGQPVDDAHDLVDAVFLFQFGVRSSMFTDNHLFGELFFPAELKRLQAIQAQVSGGLHSQRFHTVVRFEFIVDTPEFKKYLLYDVLDILRIMQQTSSAAGKFIP